jgi:hypothetical protein
VTPNARTGRRVGEQNLNMTGDQVIQRRHRALIGVWSSENFLVVSKHSPKSVL